MAVLDNVKVLLGITDSLQDELLRVIQRLTESHFKAYAGLDEVPDEASFIITEVMVKRFNRIGAEGVKSQKIGELTADYSLDDFAVYEDIIKRLSGQKVTKGVRFL